MATIYDPQAYKKWKEKYGVSANTTNKNDKGKQSNSASSKSTQRDKTAHTKTAQVVNQIGKTAYEKNEFNTETKNAYKSAKNKAHSKTTITSNMTDDERKKRINDIDAEIRNLNYTIQGLGKGASYVKPNDRGYLTNRAEEARKKIEELTEEKKNLERVGTFTASEMKQFEIDDAKARKAALPTFNPTSRVMPDDVDAYVENAKAHTKADKKIDQLKREQTLYDDIVKYGDVVLNDNNSGDGFFEFITNPVNWGKDFINQFRANYRNADLSRDADKAMSEYIKNPTEENRQIAYAYDAFSKEYMKNNANALDEENVKAGWLTKSAAGYLPQFKDQIIPELAGGAIGSMLFGKAGGTIGSAMGTYSQMYDVMVGSVYRTLLAEGVDEQTAKQAAEDEALISSLIESGGTAISWLFLGGSKAMKAIGNAATKSVAKGTANSATKYVANKVLTHTAKQASQPLWKGVVKGGLGIVGNALSEYGEEFAQGAVSIANRERATSSIPIDGKWNLIQNSGDIIADAVTGKNPEAFAELHEQGKEGFKIGLMFGGSQSVINNTVSRLLNANTIQEQNEVLDFVRNDEETLDALVEEGKESGKGTVSEKIANEIETARENGKAITREQVKRLISSNEVYIQSEKQNTAKTLEQAAVEFVEARESKSIPTYQVLETLSRNNEPISVADVKKVTGFGEKGAEFVANYTNQNGVTFSQVMSEVKTSYMTGLKNPDLDIKTLQNTFISSAQADAFTAGKQDSVLQSIADKERAQIAFANKESGFFTENLPSDVTKTQGQILNTLYEAVGLKGYMAKGLKGNAEYNRKTGEAPIDIDFQREINTDNGKQKVSIVFHAAHEAALHRVIDLAPQEGRAFVYAMYNHLAGNEESIYTLADQKRDAYAEQGVNISLAEAMEEISANHILALYNNNETKFKNAIESIANGTNTQAKQGLRKYIDILNKIIRKIREFLSGKTASQRAEIQAELDEITKLRDMFENAFAKAVENRNALPVKSTDANSVNNLEINANEDYNGNISYSVKKFGDEDYTTEGTKWAIANGLLSRSEQAAFWENISELNKNGYYKHRSKSGQYIIDVGSKLVFTDGDFKATTISSIIEFKDGYEANINDFKEWIFNEERDTAQHGESLQIIEIVQGEGYVSEHLSSTYRANEREDGRRKGNDGTATNRRGQQDVSRSNESNTFKEGVQFSLKEDDINQSMTMDEAKQMIQRAFILGGIQEWYDNEYKNGDEWLRGEGASDVALYIENEYALTEKYLNKLPGYIDGDFYVEDILEAYLKGTLVGKEKPKTKRLDISKEYRINDERFYSPQRINNAKQLLNVAMQRVTNENRAEVTNARAKILIFAHNKGASELLGLTQAELNKKLRAWSNYSAKARDISKKFNNGVADSNKWTGIENCSWLYKGTVETKDLESLVKDIKGAAGEYEKMYIARTMLALDTHIDWSWLSFEFDTYNGVNKGKTFSVSKCLGYYTNEQRKIVVSHDKPHTVAHEMGHALDYQWARDLGFNYTALTEVSRLTEKITDVDEKQFFENFKIFIDSLTDNGDIRSEYTQDAKEVFARFVARFVQWVDNTGTGRNTYNTETLYYNDKFTASHYIEFVKLLQEKAMLDSKKLENKSYSLKETDNVQNNQMEYNHFYNEKTVSKEFLKSVNLEIENAILNIRNGNPEAVPDTIEVTMLADKTVNSISDFVGFDVSGYVCKIEKDALQHIEKRHGINGLHDQSLSDPKDTARMGYVINNIDNIEWVTDEKGNIVLSKKYNNKDNTSCPVISLSSRIDGTYCVSQVVPDTRRKTIWISSARIEKADVGNQVPNGNNVTPQRTSETPLDSSSATNSVKQKSKNVKQQKELHIDESFSLKNIREVTPSGWKNFVGAVEDLQNGKKGASERLAKYVDNGMIRTEVYNALIEKYGGIETGENPYRDVVVPKKTDKDKKVSQTVRTILEAKATPDEALPTIEKMVEDGVFSYDVYTDKQAITDSEDYLREYGWSASYNDWMKDVEKGIVTKQHTVMGWALYNNAVNTAATTTSETERRTAMETALNVLDAMVKHQRNAAQALQATRILKKLSPETQLYGVQKSVQALQKELTDKYGKKAPNLKINEELAADFLEATTEDERLKAEKEIYRDIGRQMPSNWLDKWNAWRYLSMLGNARTHVRNIVGNAFFVPVVLIKDLAATGIESIVYSVSNKKTLRGKSLVVKADGTLLKAAWADYGNIADMISNGGKYNDSAMKNKYIEEGRKIFKTKALEWARKKNSELLEKEDMWFAQPHYAYALAQYCKANNITAEQIQKGIAIAPAREYAIKEAQKATYRDTNVFSQFISELGRFENRKNFATKSGSIVLEGVLPFRKTPANILVRGVEYSPIGLLKGLSYDLKQVSKGEMTSSEAIDNISAGLTGTGLLILGAVLAAQGLIRGHGEDEKEEKEFKEMMGHQKYALELPNGKSITLDWLAPEALPFFVGVNIWEMKRASDGEVNMASILNALTGITEPMLEMSCLQGINDLIESVGNAYTNDTFGLFSILASAVTSYVMQGIPTVFGQIERTGEKERMTTYTEKNAFLTGDMQYTLGKASAKIPFWDYNQIPYIDAWGRKEASGVALKRGLNNFLNPAYTSTIEESGMEKELLRLYEKTGETSVFPTRADKHFTVDEKRKDLTADEYVRYATLKGEKSYKLVSDLVKSSSYQKLSDEEKVKAIEIAYDYANQKAKKSVSNYKPQSWVGKADGFGTNVESYLTFKAEVNNTRQENGDKISKQEVADIILDSAQNDDIAWKMYFSMYGSNSDAYAYNNGIEGGTYMEFISALNEIDEPNDAGKYGTFTQKEAEKAVNQLKGLSREEKAALYQSVNTTWKKNPFR